MRFKCEGESCGVRIITTGYPGTCPRCGSILSVTYDNIGATQYEHKNFKQLKEEDILTQFDQMMEEIERYLKDHGEEDISNSI